jgi:hypothetical protein
VREWGEGELGRMYAQDDPPLPLLEERLGVLAAVLGERHLPYRTLHCTAVGVPECARTGGWATGWGCGGMAEVVSMCEIGCEATGGSLAS